MEKEKLSINNGDTYVGQFKGSMRHVFCRVHRSSLLLNIHGHGKMIYITRKPDGDPFDIGEYVGIFKRDIRDGEGYMDYANGAKFNGIWRNDRKFIGEYKMIDGTLYSE
jgi:hypothetical protein